MLINVDSLTKTYKVHERAEGVAAALKSVFRRNYRDVNAVAGISFKIGDGERVGFLGPNGAGKTTTLKMLSGLLHPTAGTLDVDGFTPRDRKVEFLGRITLVTGQKQQLLWDLPPVETFEMNRAIYGIPSAQYLATRTMLVDLLDAGTLIHKPTRQLSLGERMKCELVAALLHRPKVLFLDEPTIGLDVSMQATVRSFIRRYNEETGATVLLTSHYMEDVAALCPRVVVIDKGVLLFDGALADLVRRTTPGKRVQLRLSAVVQAGDLERFGRVVEVDGMTATLQVDQEKLKDSVRGLLDALPVVDLSVQDAPLDDVMRDVFKQGRAANP